MLRDILRIVQFAASSPKSFANISLWGRREAHRSKLQRLADKYGSDKGFRKTLYTRIYDDLLSPHRETLSRMLEIGLLCHMDQHRIGGTKFDKAPSLDMWAEYFPNAKVYGFDIRDFSSASGKWERIYRGDQSKRDDLRQVIEDGGLFDLVIDDALHASYHQQVSFSFLFKHVRPGGCYVIEDLHFQPEAEERLRNIEKTSEYLLDLKLSGKWSSPVASDEEKAFIEAHVESIQFFDNMSGGIAGADALAVIRKRNAEVR